MEDEAAGPANQSPVRLLVVEDSAALAEALLFAFGFEKDIEPIGVAPTISRALEMVDAERPDVVLMDVRLPDGSGLDAATQIVARQPGTPVIIMTAHADHLMALEAAEAGAAGFLLKDVRIAKMVAGVRGAAAGAVAVEPAILASVLTQVAAGGSPPDLSPPEQSAVRLLADGLDRRAVADRLGLDEGEGGAVIDSARARLGARSNLEAVVLAAAAGLIGGSEHDPTSPMSSR
jgi:DNA-binding NarL/FixJ family response regulator